MVSEGEDEHGDGEAVNCSGMAVNCDGRAKQNNARATHSLALAWQGPESRGKRVERICIGKGAIRIA